MEPGVGFEPTATALQVRCSGQLSYPGRCVADDEKCVAGAEGFEPSSTGPKPVVLPLNDAPLCCDSRCARSRISGRLRNRTPGLSPTPDFKSGCRPFSGTFHTCTFVQWSGWGDSNSRPPGPKPGALPTAPHPVSLPRHASTAATIRTWPHTLENFSKGVTQDAKRPPLETPEAACVA